MLSEKRPIKVAIQFWSKRFSLYDSSISLRISTLCVLVDVFCASSINFFMRSNESQTALLCMPSNNACFTTDISFLSTKTIIPFKQNIYTNQTNDATKRLTTQPTYRTEPSYRRNLCGGKYRVYLS